MRRVLFARLDSQHPIGHIRSDAVGDAVALDNPQRDGLGVGKAHSSGRVQGRADAMPRNCDSADNRLM
jgi:hypothetical protein